MKNCLLLGMLLMGIWAHAQERIPLESWRTHFSYADIRALTDAGDRLYAASRNGLFYVDKASGETETLSELNGLSAAGINALAYHAPSQNLFIGYRNGLIDVRAADGSVRALNYISAGQLPGERQLYTFFLQQDSLYIGFDAGILLLNTESLEVINSWLNLGESGERLPVNGIVTLRDSVYALAGAEVIGTSLAADINQADFANWQRFGSEEGLSGSRPIGFARAGEKLFLGLEDGLYRRTATGWEKELALDGLQALAAEPNRLYLAQPTQLSILSLPDRQTQTLTSDYFSQLQRMLLTDNAQIWLGDGRNGLLNGSTEQAFQRYSPPGPLSDAVTKLYAQAGRVLALYGQAEASLPPQDVQPGFSVFAEGSWRNFAPAETAGMPPAANLRGAAYAPREQAYYLASFADGLIRWQPEDNTFQHWQAGDVDVSLQGTLYGTLLSDVAVDAEGRIWMLNFGVDAPLHRYDPAEESWDAYFSDNNTLSQAQELLIPFSGDAWILPGSTNGILVANPEEQLSLRRLSKQSNNGGLVSDAVTSLAEDLDGSVWIGTEEGINYLPTSFDVLSSRSINAVRPVYQERFLLRDESITALAVDGGNRKWIGTRNGLWCFGDFGDTLYYRFTPENSPLPSPEVLSLAVQQESGEVFVATSQGVVSFRSASSLGGETHAGSLRVYPNPVRWPFEGKVGIEGLVRDANVKITDLAGRLVRELAAEGGTASWNARDAEGRPVPPGIYLIFSANADGSETLAGKLAIIR